MQVSGAGCSSLQGLRDPRGGPGPWGLRARGNGVRPDDAARAHLPHPWAGPDRCSSPGNGPASASKTGAAGPPSGPSWGSRSRGGSSLGCRKASLGGRGKNKNGRPGPGREGPRRGPASGSLWLGQLLPPLPHQLGCAARPRASHRSHGPGAGGTDRVSATETSARKNSA